jgi:putative addiction module component (TIGR02574 family)
MRKYRTERGTKYGCQHLSELLKLPPGERAELAIALWDSLTDAERESELTLTAEQRAELDRRWAELLRNPDSGVPWDEVKRRLQGRK